jgi:glyoxylase-like metal-dependent hydrolase (beta-lactamase superfamily II)
VPPSWEVLAIRTGTVASTRAATYYRYGVYGEADGPLQMDYFYWVLRNGDETILLDTGFHPDAARRRGRDVTTEPVAALDGLGIDPASVSRVVVSHFHYDHIGNVSAFPTARLHLQRRELDFWGGPYGRRALFAPTTEAAELDYLIEAARDGRAEVSDGDIEIAPGIRAELVGGHCPGEQILHVETERGPVALVSDAVHMYEEVERDMPFDIFSDLEGMYSTFAYLRELTGRGVTVVAGHDPRVCTDFSPVSGPAAAYAFQIA